jgi:single-stranded-DNA-specific exonuclease
LTTQNPIETKNLAEQLDELNKQRQQIETEMMKELIPEIDESLNFICSYSKRWHTGIIGIVAGRLKEKFNKPSIVIAIDENGNGRASCRSISNVDISAIINKGISAGIISSGGGHLLAAGFSIKEGKIADLIEFLKSEIKYEITAQELYADCFLPINSISFDTMKSISALEPFGNGNRHPKFIIPNVMIVSACVVGKNHIRLTLMDDKKKYLRAISFKSFETPLGDILMSCNTIIHALGTIFVSEWKGDRQISFQLEDVASPIDIE